MRYVVWPLPDPPPPFTWAHRVVWTGRIDGVDRLGVVCGIPTEPMVWDEGPPLIGNEQLVWDNGECVACATGRPWDDVPEAEMMAGARLIRGPEEGT